MAKAKKSTKKGGGTKVDVYQVVTDMVLEALDAGVVPWKKPGNRPRNLASGKVYRGVNVWILAIAGYASPYWVTFKQAKDRGGSVRKGEKGTKVVLWRWLEAKEEEPETGRKKRFPILRYYTVFNVEQCDGLDVPASERKVGEFDPLAEAEGILEGFDGPEVVYGGSAAYYAPALDRVALPERSTFRSVEGFYATAFHELGHSTGHADRLNRPEVSGPVYFGSEDYSREELVAEMTSAFLCAHAGIVETTIENSAAYIEYWRSKISADPKLVVNVAAAAQKAADLVLGEEREVKDA